MKNKLLVIMVLFFFLGLGEAHAQLRCGNDLMTVGDSEAKVLARCGPPAQQITTYRENSQINTISPIKQVEKVQTTVDIWTYNFGSQRLQYKLTFENGQLVNIETGDYGY